MQQYDDIPQLLLWKPYSKGQLAMSLSDFLLKNGKTDNGTTLSPRRLYYINPVNSFPLEEFQKLVPLNVPSNKHIYDNIMINQVLNMNELSKTIDKIIETTKDTTDSNENESNPKAVHTIPSEALIVISGIDIMFQNSNMSDTTHAHNLLNSILLQLRLTANTNHGSFKTVVLSRDQGVPRSGSTTSQKRAKHDGNTVYDYISKYYADYTL